MKGAALPLTSLVDVFRIPIRPFELCWSVLLIAAIATIPTPSLAQRDVHWQIEPAGFPDTVSVFVDVEENWNFRRDLEADDFSIAIDEHVGDQGGRILNAKQVRVGVSGAQVLLLVDRSRTYTSNFSNAKQAMREVIARLDPARDHVAIVSAPSGTGYTDTVLEHPFSSDRVSLQKTIDRLTPISGNEITPARVCHALAEAIRTFPEERTGRYRAILFFSAGIDRGEGRGDCVQRSFQAGKVPFFMVTYDPDRRYRSTTNEHRVENALDALAQQTGGRSIFRRSSSQIQGFINKLVYRIRSQYRLDVSFPCYRPAPATEHLAVLKVEGRDADGLRFQAPSTLAPVPTITSVVPSGATRDVVDDGNVEITISGSGFCGSRGGVKAYVGDSPLSITSQDPFRLVARLRPNTESGDVKVINRFGEASESDEQFKVISPEPGEEASTTLTVLILVIVLMAMIGVVLFALRKRQATLDTSAAAPQIARRKEKSARPMLVGIDAAETIPMRPIRRAWVELDSGRSLVLSDGDNVIGRDRSCSLQLDIQGVSREHAKIELNSKQGVVWLEDLGSTNGTYWGSAGTSAKEAVQLRDRRSLDSEDIIVIGGERMTVHIQR
jgi:hypothetical protein